MGVFFFVRVPLEVRKAMEDEIRNKPHGCEGENVEKQRKGSHNNTEGQMDIKKQNSTENELGIGTKRANNIAVKNLNELSKE